MQRSTVQPALPALGFAAAPAGAAAAGSGLALPAAAASTSPLVTMLRGPLGEICVRLSPATL